MHVIEVLGGGMFTTVQDLGRYGYQRYGVPVSGAMDTFALRAANLLVGNQEGDAGLEMTMAGPHLRFLDETVVAVTGAGPHAHIGRQPDLHVAARGGAERRRASVPRAQGRGESLSCYSGRRGRPVHAWQPLHLYTGQHRRGWKAAPVAHGDRMAGSSGMERVEGRRFPQGAVPRYGHTLRLRATPGAAVRCLHRTGYRGLPVVQLYGDTPVGPDRLQAGRAANRAQDRRGHCLGRYPRWEQSR